MIIHDFIHLIEVKTGHSVKKSGAGYSACCPAHEDSTPSLSVSEATDGKVLVNCFSGCKPEEICASLGIKMADLFSETIPAEIESSKRRIEHSYHDEKGNLLFSKIRIEPGFNGKTKSFYWERMDSQGAVVKKLDGCRKVLYKLPELLEAISQGNLIFLVEGEKDADTLSNFGLAATTAPESLKWHEEFSSMLQSADVVILYDMDKTGIERRDVLTKALHGKVKRLRVVDLPGLEYQESHGQDISDWLAAGHTTTQLLETVANTANYTTPQAKGKIRAVTMDEFLKMELPPREMILTPFLPSQGLCLLYAKRGVGKTHVALGIAYAVATGGTFLKWSAPRPRKVLYIDGEMPASAMQERLRRISVSEGIEPPDPSFLCLVTPDLQEGAMPGDIVKSCVLGSEHILGFFL